MHFDSLLIFNLAFANQSYQILIFTNDNITHSK